jgi:hypothetical protein
VLHFGGATILKTFTYEVNCQINARVLKAGKFGKSIADFHEIR